ncbi:hypothetical protein [Novosphingobium rosa]|uniref:hypothetical protein n=1 Tax=Novosphingobium rosa TaxID=76978 RepID=UPI0008365E4E|nr:hypothetical protein [Novosphingobium rosa]
MRRSLVLGDEAARHPFLQSLPPHVRSGTAVVINRGVEAGTHPLRAALAARSQAAMANVTARDVRHFLLAYCSCFLAVSTFIW